MVEKQGQKIRAGVSPPPCKVELVNFILNYQSILLDILDSQCRPQQCHFSMAKAFLNFTHEKKTLPQTTKCQLNLPLIRSNPIRYYCMFYMTRCQMSWNICPLTSSSVYVSVHNRSFIPARKPSYAQKDYLCGFSDS